MQSIRVTSDKENEGTGKSVSTEEKKLVTKEAFINGNETQREAKSMRKQTNKQTKVERNQIKQ